MAGIIAANAAIKTVNKITESNPELAKSLGEGVGDLGGNVRNISDNVSYKKTSSEINSARELRQKSAELKAEAISQKILSKGHSVAGDTSAAYAAKAAAAKAKSLAKSAKSEAASRNRTAIVLGYAETLGNAGKVASDVVGSGVETVSSGVKGLGKEPDKMNLFGESTRSSNPNAIPMSEFGKNTTTD